ncbi:MAG TPA: hypothetical protein VJ748_08950 [Vitreimonas sp.]|jgi:hypothetical protein|nr:hypothetical protein [Vitreimonas sp.]
MRFALISAALLALASCASTTPSVSTPEASAPAQAPSYSSLAAQLLASAGRADAPSRAELDRAFGAPDIERREGAGVALTYRLESCALLLLMTADARNEMRLAEAHASARRAGEAAPSLEQCAAEASQRRS